MLQTPPTVSPEWIFGGFGVLALYVLGSFITGHLRSGKVEDARYAEMAARNQKLEEQLERITKEMARNASVTRLAARASRDTVSTLTDRDQLQLIMELIRSGELQPPGDDR